MGTYRIIQKLATGGMAEVFLGKVVGVEGFEKPVAVKRILQTYARDAAFVDLFLREAKVSVALQHANVMQVLDLGSSDGQFYMVMEFVDGEDLRKVLKVARLRKLPLGLREMCFIAQQVADGLAYAQSRTDASGAPLNIVHRDINPSNVMIASNGEVKLADFGIAKVADGHPETQAGVLKGKIHYLAPEQILGRPVDQRSDIFLMGLLLYELLAGHQLFDGPYLQVVQKIGGFDERTLEPIPGVPAPLWAIVLRALAAAPAARYRTARELSDALQAFLYDHRLRVGASDIAALFARAFPERRSPLEDLATVQGEEIHLEGQDTPRPSAAPPAARADPRRPAAPSLPPVLRASGQVPAVGPRLVPADRGPMAPDDATRALPAPHEPPRPAPAPPAPPKGAVPPPPPAPVAASPGRPARPTRRLGDVLVARGLLTPKALEEALALQKRQGGKLGQVLVAEKLVGAEDVVRALSELTGLPHISDDKLQTMPVPTELVSQLTMELCEKLCAVPVTQRGKELYCAVLEPRDLKVLDALKFSVRAITVHGLFASEHAIRRAIRRFYLGKDSLVELDAAQAEASGRERMMDFVEQFTGGRAVLDEKALSGESSEPAAKPAAAPLPGVAPNASRTRMVLVVADAPEPRELAVKLLLLEGLAAAASPSSAAEQALALGGYDVVLVVESLVPEAGAVAARLRAAHPELEVRLLPSLGAALSGEGGPLARLDALHHRVLAGALAMLGGSAALAPQLVQLARRCAARMGAGGVEESMVGAASEVLALAARLEDPKRFVLPSLGRVRALVGNDFPEVAELLGTALSPEGPTGRPLSRAAQAVLSAAVFIQQTQNAQPAPAESAQALGVLAKHAQLTPAAVEALTAELGATSQGAGNAPRVVIAESDTASAITLQVRLMAEGLSVRRTQTRAETEKAAIAGAQALILSTSLPDGETHTLVRALRKLPATATLPLFLLASTDDPAVVTAGLEAGADDVLVRPFNVEVLTAKLRRALAQRQRAGRG